MSETQLTDAEALALAGTTDGDTDFEYHTVGQSTYYLDGLRQRHLILRIMKAINAFRTYQDGTLTFGVRPGRFLHGNAAIDYAGATEQSLTNNQTNYIYLTAAGTLTVNTAGFPAPSATPHMPLAEIVTSAGAVTSVTDRRSQTLFRPLTVRPELTFSGTDDADGTGTMDIQVSDEAGNAIAGRWRIRTWVANANMSEPDAQTDYSVAVGEQLRQLEANADYEVITTAAGLATMNIDAGGAKTVHVMAEIDGRIYSQSLTITL